MPRKDPITGCSVMTITEFLQAEAECENKEKGTNKTGGDIWEEIVDEMNNSSREEEARIRQDPSMLLMDIQKHCHEVLDDDSSAIVPMPISVLEVLEVQCEQSFRSSGIKAKLRCLCDDNKARNFTFTYKHWDGSRMEPPDSDTEVTWED